MPELAWNQLPASCLGSQMFTRTEWCRVAASLSLSPREMEIVRRVFDDEKEAAIARQLQISPHTVHTYLERIYRKLSVKSRLQMAVRVMAEHLRGMNDNDDFQKSRSIAE